MAEFVYDEMVTAQSLNEIAVDLGAGDFSAFEDGTPYAVGKLNEITQSLVGSGISSALNKFEITVSQDSIVVGTGIAFFASGKKLKLTVPVTLPFQAGELYLYEKLSTGAVSINVGELPADNYVHLATINEDATFIDRRMIAKAKVELPTEGNSCVFSDTITPSTAVECNGKTITFPIAGVTKIFITADNTAYSQAIARIEYDVKTQKFNGISLNDEYKALVDGVSATIFYNKSYPSRTVKIGVSSQTEQEVTFIYATGGFQYQTDALLGLSYYAFGGVEK